MPKLYRFTSIVTGEHGESFALCARHLETQPVPAPVILEEIGSSTSIICKRCVTEQEEQGDAPK